MNVHHKCQNKVANLCGVNQKLMAEALAIIETKQQVRRQRGCNQNFPLKLEVFRMFFDSKSKPLAVLSPVFRPELLKKVMTSVEKVR